MAKVIYVSSALQKIRRKDGSYEIVFPITRSRDVLVDVQNQISLDVVLSGLASGSDNVASRDRLNHDFATLINGLSPLLPRPLVMNNFATYDATDTTQMSRTNNGVMGIQYLQRQAAPCGPVMPSQARILLTGTGTVLPENVIFKIHIANNGFDDVVAWEDATEAFTTNSLHIFTNTKKQTNRSWGIIVRVTYTFKVANAGSYNLTSLTTHFQ